MLVFWTFKDFLVFYIFFGYFLVFISRKSLGISGVYVYVGGIFLKFYMLVRLVVLAKFVHKCHIMYQE